MASSYEKIIKKLMDTFTDGLSPLRTITQNQEVIIHQNKQIIELLDSMDDKLGHRPAETPQSPSDE